MNNMKDAEFPSQQLHTPQGHYQPVQDDEIDLRELFAAIWAGKWLITGVTTVFAVASVIIALSLPNIYKSEVLLAPADNQQQGGLGALAGQFGGLAAMAGINLGGGNTDQTTLALEVLKSREFITGFIDRHDILVPLMAAEGWDRATNKLELDADVYDEKSGQWVREVKAPFQPKPSAQEAYKEFIEESLSVGKDKKTGMVTLGINHYSPEIAQQWATWLVEDLNEVMRQRDQAEATKSIQYLESQIEKTRLADLKSMLYQLVEEQTKILMFAEVRDEYVFKTIDPAVVPEEKASPRRALICVLGVMLGGLLSFIFVLIRYFSKKDCT
ncbi:Wzz/FepE/Etk N-terminal domain-containing protein [Gallaecimonas sp. GXIMD4217]|uniref:Wzz/FepE/Etk N-terminal domain-containing protein n=1 Tax=Gallaecimonas sp. GXIMD4217 TaxID=3131927 RepID=UPI00311ABBBF